MLISMCEALEENFREFSEEFEVIIHCWLISSLELNVCKIEMIVTVGGEQILCKFDKTISMQL